MLHYSPLQTGLAFLPGSLIMGALSLACRRTRGPLRHHTPLAAGLCSPPQGWCCWPAPPPAAPSYPTSCPARSCSAWGSGIALNLLPLAATGDVRPEIGWRSPGLANTSLMLQAPALAVLA